MANYVLVFVAAFIVDVVPFFGPPAWTVMVFFQIRYGLNIWLVIVTGVLGSTLGRYVLSVYIPFLSARIIKKQKNQDIQFIGEKLAHRGWLVQGFILLYTLMPLPSTPLFTAAGIARVRPGRIIPAFIIGKFTSDTIMVLSGDYAARNALAVTQGFLSWKTISGAMLGVFIICVFLFIDWRVLLQEKRFKLSFNIWR